ncbi:hypothetical protein MUG84_07725 [Paenibacillus sp. KQZ6P-2]|uniref:Uncharacterized protein n=1 Tax=Paenibacillus mangrovi TaxID=2931978 RepID=A0A9X2B1L2_9BACL|nr:hypothetical protein [Paenibacillus mangrovi]MCJ8011639.1 hypothetical protein [Paenibacillus mangrovi]
MTDFRSNSQVQGTEKKGAAYLFCCLFILEIISYMFTAEPGGFAVVMPYFDICTIS